LSNNVERIRIFTLGVSSEQACWKPDSRSWSILEVINHLLDEEREDFRTHLDLILHHPQDPWLVIDPEGWVTQRQYNQRGLEKSVSNFVQARRESLAWLKSLPAQDWESSYTAPYGLITAGEMLASWAAHDVLHLRQLVELHWAHTIRLASPYHVEYAGKW
jgi:hypothetical protein